VLAQRTQHFELLAYLPAVTVAIHKLVSTDAQQKVTFPTLQAKACI